MGIRDATKGELQLSRYVVLEHHPNDSRIRVSEDGICQTLSQRMGTGGGNVPLVIKVEENEHEDTDNAE